MTDIKRLKAKLERKIKRQKTRIRALHESKERLDCQEVARVYNYFGGYTHGLDEGILDGLARALEYIEDTEEDEHNETKRYDR